MEQPHHEQPEEADSLLRSVQQAASLGRIGFKVRHMPSLVANIWAVDRAIQWGKAMKSPDLSLSISSCLLFTDPRAQKCSLGDQKLSRSTTVHGTQFEPPVRIEPHFCKTIPNLPDLVRKLVRRGKVCSPLASKAMAEAGIG